MNIIVSQADDTAHDDPVTAQSTSEPPTKAVSENLSAYSDSSYVTAASIEILLC